MKVSCPSCQKVYKLPDEKMRPEGVKVKCKDCGFVFVVMPEDAVPKEARFLIQTPEGEKFGPWVKSEVMERIRKGEVKRGYIAYREGEMKPYPVEELPEFVDAPWPSLPAAEDLGFSTTIPPQPFAQEEGLFGGAEPMERKPLEEDLFSGRMSLGTEQGLLGEEVFASSAPSGSQSPDEDLFGEGEWGGGDQKVKTTEEVPPTSRGIGLEEDLFAETPQTASPAPSPFGSEDLEGGVPVVGKGGIEEDLFGDFSPPQPAPTSSPPPAEDLFGELGGETTTTAFSQPPVPPPQDSLDHLFSEEPVTPAPSPSHDLEETAFAFSEAEAAPKEEEYEEERLARAESKVREELFKPQPQPTPLEELEEASLPPSQPGVVSEEELITTLQELKKVRRARAGKAMWLTFAGVVLFLGVLTGSVFLSPSLWLKIPYVGGKVENLHARLGTRFFTGRILPEHLTRIRKGIESFNPKEVTAVTPDLRWVLTYAPQHPEARRLLLIAQYFYRIIVKRDDLTLDSLKNLPESQMVLWALGEGGVEPQQGSSTLIPFLKAYRSFTVAENPEDIDRALAPFTMSTELTGVESLLLVMTKARMAEEGEDFEQALAFWEKAHEFQPGNPWFVLKSLMIRVHYLPVWTEVEEILKDLSQNLESLSVYDQALYYGIRARMALALEKERDALNEAEKGLAIYPNHPELLTLAGVAHFRLRHLSDASLFLEKAYHYARDASETVLGYAQVLNAVGRVQEAIQIIEKANKDSPHVAYYGALIEILLNQNRLNDADALLKEAFLRFPDDPLLFRLGADIRLSQGDMSRATEYLDRYRTLFPNDLRAMVKLVALRLREDNIAEAKELLQNIFAINPSEPEALRYQAQIFLHEGAFSEAERILLNALELDPQRFETFLLLAEVYLNLKDSRNAHGMIQQALSLQSLHWKAQELLGRTYLLENKVTDAVAAFEKAVELSGSLPETILWLARALETQNQPGKALDQYRRLLTVDPGSKEAMRKIAELNIAIGQWREALEILDAWKKNDPDNPVLYILYGRALNGKGEYEQTIRHLTPVLSRYPREADLYNELGWAYVKTSQPQRAQALLSRAVQLKAEDGLLWYRLGLAYRDLGMKTRAKEALEKAISLGLPYELKESAQSEIKTLSY